MNLRGLIGHTITHVAKGEYETELLIHLDDGSVVQIEATGWDVDDLEVARIDGAEFRRRAKAAQGRRERAQVRRLEREADPLRPLDLLVTPLVGRMWHAEMLAAHASLRTDMARQVYGGFTAVVEGEGAKPQPPTFT